MAEPGSQGRGARQSRSGAALRRLERTQIAGARHSAAGRRTPRPHLQSRPWHSSRNSGRERESAVRFRPRALGRVQDGAQDGAEDGVKKMTACPLALSGRCYCANHVSSFAASEQSSDLSAKTAVLMLAHGSPENPSQVPEFLNNVTGGRLLPPAVVEEIRHRYSLIGFSPLACWTLLQADQLSQSLLSQSLKMPVFVGMRNWKPFIGDTVKEIASQGFERVIAISLAPQNSRTSVGLYRRAVIGDGDLPFKVDFVEQWHDHPLLVRAFAEKLRSG